MPDEASPFAGAGARPGLAVWRIVSLEPVRLDEDDIGVFRKGKHQALLRPVGHAVSFRILKALWSLISGSFIAMDCRNAGKSREVQERFIEYFVAENLVATNARFIASYIE